VGGVAKAFSSATFSCRATIDRRSTSISPAMITNAENQPLRTTRKSGKVLSVWMFNRG
jgi:hypothetical protein